jgi:hypothetical protein
MVILEVLRGSQVSTKYYPNHCRDGCMMLTLIHTLVGLRDLLRIRSGVACPLCEPTRQHVVDIDFPRDDLRTHGAGGHEQERDDSVTKHKTLPMVARRYERATKSSHGAKSLTHRM